MKNLLILKFTEKDLNKISSIHYVIDDFEKKYPNLKNKIIILIIYKKKIKKKFFKFKFNKYKIDKINNVMNITNK